MEKVLGHTYIKILTLLSLSCEMSLFFYLHFLVFSQNFCIKLVLILYEEKCKMDADLMSERKRKAARTVGTSTFNVSEEEEPTSYTWTF